MTKISHNLLLCSRFRNVITASSRLRGIATAAKVGYEEFHKVAPQQDELDCYLDKLIHNLPRERSASIRDLYAQYQNEAGLVLDRVVPYDESPSMSRRADQLSLKDETGDGIVLVVHGQLSEDRLRLLKTTVCSGFVVNASITQPHQGDTIVTCAHTLEEIQRHLNRNNESSTAPDTISFVIPPDGQARVITKLLSSMPRSDVIVLEAQSVQAEKRLRSLPLSPYPVHTGTPVLTHLFGSPDPPVVRQSIARTTAVKTFDNPGIEEPIRCAAGYAWRRWGLGTMLGYRSYTGLELEAGISSVLPHILTSVLPTSGSSGGPLVHAEKGTVVGMTSGRRMDNRVEGERGWGCSAESIFEMFSLPGFMPSSVHKHPYP